MNDRHDPAADAAARVLAAMVAANGRVDRRELQALDTLDAFGQLGLDRERFVALAEEGVASRAEAPWAAMEPPLSLLAAVTDRAQRLRLCRLAAAVITADGEVSPAERMAYERVLAHWCITPQMVRSEIRRQPPRDDGGSAVRPLGG